MNREIKSESKAAVKKYTDLTYLKSLSKGDDGFVKQMITIFINQTPAAIEQLEKSLISKDFLTLNAVAHKIKPSFSFVGINSLQAKLEELEKNALQQKDINSINILINEIKEVALIAVKELQSENLK
ncbi:MAG: Hpt domain-containing protein [Bacteroidia bacterium]